MVGVCRLYTTAPVIHVAQTTGLLAGGIRGLRDTAAVRQDPANLGLQTAATQILHSDSMECSKDHLPPDAIPHFVCPTQFLERQISFIVDSKSGVPRKAKQRNNGEWRA